MTRAAVRHAFRKLVARARRLGYLPKPIGLRWGRAGAFPAPRDHGYTDGRTVTVAPKLASASARRVAGVLAHELGHAVLMQVGLPNHSEVDADRVGTLLLGAPVGYDAGDVQAAGVKRKRPRYLPK